MKRAFTRHTTVVAYLELSGEGYFNEYNEWEKGTASELQPIRATITPAGMADQAVFGTLLEARPEGERIAKYLQISSTTEMPINSKIFYLEGIYKVVRLSDYRAAGFHTVIAEDVRGKYAF